LVFVLVLLAFAAPRGRAHAQERQMDRAPCPARGWPWVQLADDVLHAPFDAAFRTLFLAQLGAGLEARHIELCAAHDDQPADAADGAASEIALSGTQGDVVTVAVRDAITGKRLAREVPLASVPRDARPLTVALAVDELLRASWLELALADAPAPRRAVPREIDALVVPPAPTNAKRHRLELGAELVAEHFGGGTAQVGVDVLVRAAPVPLLFVRVALGLRSGATAHAADGDIRSTALDANVGMDLVIPPRSARWQFAVAVDGRLIRARFSGEPRTDARGGDAAATAIYLGAGLRGNVRLAGAFGLSLTGGFGVPVHAVDVFDGGTRVAGLSGPLLSLSVGGWWRWP
jgi:hypothetical protein